VGNPQAEQQQRQRPVLGIRDRVRQLFSRLPGEAVQLD